MADRSPTFSGSMRAVPRSPRMAIRFSLEERIGANPFVRRDVPSLAAWRESRVGVRRFGYRQTVKALKTGGAYRSLVDFRWSDGRGRIIRTARRRSGACLQPGPLPNLRLSALSARPGPESGTTTYSLSVRNTGRAPARGVVVALAVDGAVVDSTEVAVLGPGESRVLTFTGPVCRRRVRAAVDPRAAIGESRERDNVLVRRCPRLGG